jgi:hypothetical protein
MGGGNGLFIPNSGRQMSGSHHWERRNFVKGVAALLGAARLSAYNMTSAAADPRPETSTIRLVKLPAICLAPEYMAEEFLRLEGFRRSSTSR